MSNKENDEVTPEPLYLNRNKFLQASIYSASAVGTAALYRWFRKPITNLENSEKLENLKQAQPPTQIALEKKEVSQLITSSFDSITNYNNFYEYSSNLQFSISPAYKNPD